MSDRKIFIALSQREARSLITAIQFTGCGCSKKVNGEIEFNEANAAIIGITAEEICELHDFSKRLELLADEQAALEIQYPEVADDIKCITFDKAAQDLLPEHIKSKMKDDREKAIAEKGEKL